MKFGLHYSFQSPTQEWGDLYNHILEQIVLADKLGFHTVTVAEHHFYADGWLPAPMAACAAIATITKHIRIGTNIIILPLYHPITVVENAAVVDLISRGRFILGVGLGVEDSEYLAFGTSRKARANRYDESVRLIKRLFTEEKVSHAGKNWSFNNVTVTPRPLQKPHPPIWFGGAQEPAIKRAAEFGDAWCPSQIESTKVLKTKYEIYREALKHFGRDFNSVEKPLRREAYVADDASTAWNEVQEAIRIEYGEVYYQMGEIRDEDGKYMKPSEVKYEEVEEQLKKRFLIGSPDDVIAHVERIQRDLPATELIFRIQLPNMKHEKVLKSIRLIGEKVIPYFST